MILNQYAINGIVIFFIFRSILSIYDTFVEWSRVDHVGSIRP